MTETTRAGAVFTARTPEDLLAVVPRVLGFHPEESLVMLTFGGRRSFHARVDLPRSPSDIDAVVQTLLVPALRERPPTVLFVAYSSDAGRAARTALRASDVFDGRGFAVIAPMRSDGRSWFDVVAGADPDQAEPHPYDVAAHLLTAQAVLEGRVTLGSRDELVASVAVDPGAAAGVLVAARADAGWRPTQRSLRVLVGRARSRSGPLTDLEVARVAVACLHPSVRDAAWCGLSRETAEEHVELWRALVVRTPDELVAGAAAVLAFCAWLAGHGALAWCAVDRARLADPHCSLAVLVADLLEGAVPPAAWSPIDGPGGAAKA
ncbi:DUF4192 domain-containing protein [Nocardioides jiangxiensis]|uniref:DUF4192 domain-containing protein n=1 Tax=Nocardioides jiangxiensis TaxID=3064524 RepID=A0ABT9B3N0_9ACTN|nr:DUF4192 domain-containing protein [Nocardioides sp. WY-20]MDO7869424.1 DUF4192 domain-containing protein [Nocardioides sp. WY-20]